MEDSDPKYSALDLIKNQLSHNNIQWTISELSQLIECMEKDSKFLSLSQSREYFYHIFSEFSSKLMNLVVDFIYKNNSIDVIFKQKLILFLIRHERPIFQAKSLPLIQESMSDFYVPYIFPLIFSEIPQIKTLAIETLFKIRGNFELMLEMTLQDKSIHKQQIVAKILQKYNPENLKLALYLLKDPDFLCRISAIQLLGKKLKQKAIPKIQDFLYDPDLAVQKATIETLNLIGGKTVKQLLLEKLQRSTHIPLQNLINSYLKGTVE